MLALARQAVLEATPQGDRRAAAARPAARNCRKRPQRQLVRRRSREAPSGRSAATRSSLTTRPLSAHRAAAAARAHSRHAGAAAPPPPAKAAAPVRNLRRLNLPLEGRSKFAEAEGGSEFREGGKFTSSVLSDCAPSPKPASPPSTLLRGGLILNPRAAVPKATSRAPRKGRHLIARPRDCRGCRSLQARSTG